jgi:hypothetical protein
VCNRYEIWAMFVVALCAGVVGGTWLMHPVPKDTSSAQQAIQDTIYYTPFGGMYCGHMEYTPCGIHLWGCVDDRVYLCMTNVAIRRDVTGEETP